MVVICLGIGVLVNVQGGIMGTIVNVNHAGNNVSRVPNTIHATHAK